MCGSIIPLKSKLYYDERFIAQITRIDYYINMFGIHPFLIINFRVNTTPNFHVFRNIINIKYGCF